MMTCGPVTTHSLSGVGALREWIDVAGTVVAHQLEVEPDHVELGDLVGRAGREPLTCALIHARGIAPPALRTASLEGVQVQPLLPSLSDTGAPPGVSGRSMIVACCAMASGAALIASAILSGVAAEANVAFASPSAAQPVSEMNDVSVSECRALGGT